MQIEGRNPVIETLQSDNTVSILYIQNGIGLSQKIKQIISLASKKGIRIRKIGARKLKKMSHTHNHQGVIAKVQRSWPSINEVLATLQSRGKLPFFVMIDEVLHQQNLGAIIRSAECAGCNGVIISKKTKVLAEAVRASMGASEHIAIMRESIFHAIKILKESAIKVIGIEADAKKNIYEEDLTGPITIIIGSEDSGIGNSLLAKCDIVLKIPLFGKISSLNMSNAAAITLFEKVRQEICVK